MYICMQVPIVSNQVRREVEDGERMEAYDNLGFLLFLDSCSCLFETYRTDSKREEGKIKIFFMLAVLLSGYHTVSLMVIPDGFVYMLMDVR